MKRVAVITLSLAALLTLPACATREKLAEEQPAQQLAAAEPAHESPKSEADAPGVVQEAQPSSGGRQSGRAAKGALRGALMGALMPIGVFSAGGPIGMAIGLYLAPIGAIVGAAIGLAHSDSSW